MNAITTGRRPLAVLAATLAATLALAAERARAPRVCPGCGPQAKFGLAGAAIALGCLALSLALAPAAGAADRVIGFDELPDNTLLTDQYLLTNDPGKGLRFGQRPPDREADHNPRVLTVPAGQSQSPPKVVQRAGSGGEFCHALDNSTWAKFTYARDRVRLSARALPGGRVFARGYSAGGGLVTIASAEAPGSGLLPLELKTQAPEIVYIRLFADSFCSAHRFDDLTFDDLAGKPLPAPDFGLVRKSPTAARVGLLKGGHTDVTVGVDRANQSSGPVSYSVAGLPSGVTASFPDGKTTASDELRVRLAATAGAAVADGVKVTVIGTPAGPSGGPAPRTLDFPLDVHGRYDLRVIGMEVTQGIQEQRTWCFTTKACRSVPSLPFPASDTNRTLAYQGVRLASFKQTVVRVFANVKTGDKVQDVAVALRAFRGGKQLPGGPLLSATKALTHRVTDLDWVTWEQRTRASRSFDFLLPPAWTDGTVKLRAELVPPLNFLGGPAECETSGCGKNNTLSMTGVRFIPTGYITMATARLWHSGEDVSAFGSIGNARFLPEPRVAFTTTEQLLPLQDGGLNYDRNSYYATINVTDIKNIYKDIVGPGGVTIFDLHKARRRASTDRLEDYADDNPGCSWARFCADSVMGVYGPGISNGGLSRDQIAEFIGVPFAFGTTNVDVLRAGDDAGVDYDGDDHLAVTSYASQNTGIHELSHGIGRVHADTACGGNDAGQDGENLTPDGRGTLDGVGYDIPARNPIAPKSLGSHAPGAADSYVDSMSYCKGDGIAKWATVTGWEKTFSLLRSIAKGKGRVGAAPSSLGARAASKPAPFEPGRVRASAANLLRVHAYADSEGAALLSVKPRSGAPEPAPAESPFEIVARDASGSELSRTRMSVEKAVVDDDGRVFLASADVPAAGVAALELLRDGVSVARRTASANRPRVRVLAPQRGRRVGRGRETAIRWRATDADRDTLEIKVAYSVNGGRSWEPIYLGPNSGGTRVPSHMLAGSPRARIRVRANDGFHETASRSAVFRAVRRRPTLRIVAPGPRDRLRADETVPLLVVAHDDRRARIRGTRRIVWFEGRRRIARGNRTSVTGLRPGKRRLRARVRDRRGGRASATVLVRVRPVRPQIIGVEAPRRVSPRARRLRLRVRTSIPALLRVSGKGAGTRRAKLSRRARTLTLRIRPGRRALRLRLRVSSGPRARTAILRIRR